MVEKRTQRTRTVLDTAQRKLRLKRFIESLDKDNFQEDLNISTAKLPAFDEKPAAKKKKKITKKRFPKSFQAILEDPANAADTSSYNSARVPISRLPARNFCSVCGYKSTYKCIMCGTKYCTIRCGMIVLENPLLDQDLEDDDSDGVVEEMEITGALTSGKISETAIKTVTHVNNVAKLRERLESIQKKMPWLESVDVTVDMKMSEDDMKTIVNDNLKQEMLFYKQCQIGTQQSIARLKSLNIPTVRPEDYFAEMVKSDEHMKRVKEKLVSKQLTLERTEKVSKMRKMKKLGKKVQQEVLKKRAEDKKQMLESVKKIRKGQAEKEDMDEFEINSIEQENPKKKDGINRKRKAKDSKYGYGGKKKNARKNDQESYKDVSSFSSRVHSKPKRSAKNDKRKGGKPQRPGKARRANMKNKAKSK